MPRPSPPETPHRRYRRVVREVLEARGRFCECCGTPARHVHHIIPCSITGMASELVFEPANMMVICNDCHMLMHPLIRRPSWTKAAKGRGIALNR
jgi:5-methylcytosine-specific restriction endonuclease McrA